MTQPKKLIEVAMPIKEISAESVRDKSIRHGHISTLHLWWARRPLPVCRAVIFCSLVPDPLDENCPQAFRDAVELLLGSEGRPMDEQDIDTNAYKPYEDIPYTAAKDKMDDNARNRLLMFVGKYSNEFVSNEKAGKRTPASRLLNDYSLIKWDNKDNEKILNKARKLIWVAHNANNRESLSSLLQDFEMKYKDIKVCEQALYKMTDRHVSSEDIRQKEADLEHAIESFLDKMPRVFDPFAGGGAIPLEAARLGCRSFGNDINPVAHIIQKGSLEYPQKFGKPITYSIKEFKNKYGADELNRVSNDNIVFRNGEPAEVSVGNRLSFDVGFYSKRLLKLAEKQIGYLYPADEKGNKPIAYYWARVGSCSNPSCRAEVPLLKGFYLANTHSKKIYLKPVIQGRKVEFEITHGQCEIEGWMSRGNLQCPVCGNTTDVKTLKQQFIDRKTSQRLLAVIYDGRGGKEYRLPTTEEISIVSKVPTNVERPSEGMAIKYTQALPSCTWGLSTWGDMFSDRQLVALQTFLSQFSQLKNELDAYESEYGKAIIVYLSILIDRLAPRQTMYGIYDTTRETISHIFGRQAIPMVFDYPESNPFSDLGGGGLSQIEWVTRYIESECKQPFATTLQNASSGEKTQFPEKFITAVVTDPPYYDAIAYADLSDFFYVWMKRILGDMFPLNFATPLTPKSDECTALKHHHEGKIEMAKQHFENKMQNIFDAIEHQTSEIVSIMFAHQGTEAWTTLCNSILGSRMNITGSWANDTELISALKNNKAFLSSSVTVACRPSQRTGYGNFKEVKKSIEKTVEKEVAILYKLGFRGADLLTACFGQAVSEFGKYEKVEKADGSEVSVAELLEMARESAFNALLKGFDGDDFTKFYIGWLQLYGFSESDFDDAAKFSRVGLSINVSDLFKEHILIQHNSKQTLGTFEDRISANRHIGERTNDNIIDLVHRAMFLFKGANRKLLLQYIDKVASQPESTVWRVLTSLCEVLPNGSDDHKQAIGLVSNKESLIKECKVINKPLTEQAKLEF